MILVDAGPLVAIVDAGDQHHQTCVDVADSFKEPVGTVWPALAEVAYLLRDLPDAGNAVWEMIEVGALSLLQLGASDLPRIRALMKKYADLPMDLADAALVAVAEREGIAKIFTVDRSDFAVYRLHGRGRFTIIP